MTTYKEFCYLIVNAGGGPTAVLEALEESVEGLEDPHDPRSYSLRSVRKACGQSKLPFGRVFQWLESLSIHCDLECYANLHPDDHYLAGAWDRFTSDLAPKSTASGEDSCS